MTGSRPTAVWRSILPVAAILLVGAALPALLTGGFQLRLATLVWIFAMLGMSFNLLYGFSGQISLGQNAFFALGAYAYAMLQVQAGWNAYVAMGASLLIAALAALVLGLPLLRLRTHYLAMGTLSFGLIFAGIANRWTEFTGGTAGVQVPPLTFSGTPLSRLQLYYVVLAVAAVVLGLHEFIARSHLGRALLALRDDETAASALGIDVNRYKLRVFVIAGTVAAAAGLCFGMVNLRADPSLSEFHTLVTLFTIAVVGGLGTRFGPLLGSVFVILLPQVLTRFGDFETLIYGCLVLGFLLFLPRGVAGFLEALPNRRRTAHPPALPVDPPHRALGEAGR